jgi:starch-binding outer membrane protein, SusD/RagB family
MMNRTRWTSLAPALALGVVLPSCDILEVNNPNSADEDDLGEILAASALVNSAVAANARGIANVWLGYLMASDEIVWIGSRDAWGQLDQGFVTNPLNEFTDAAFPLLTQARWVADTATVILDAHVDTVGTLTTSLVADQARAWLHAGLIYTIIGEVQEDFVFGHKRVAEAPIGPANMKTVLDEAILRLDRAVTIATEIDNADLLNRAQAVRARAKHSRAIWDRIKPTVNTAEPLASSEGASADAAAVLARVSGSWRFQLTYSAATLSNFMASEINSRGEQQFDTTSIVSVNKAAPKTILGVKLQDPIGAAPDVRILTFLREWKGDQNIGIAGTVYAPLTMTSAKHMYLILAEDELVKGNMAGFTTHINAVREIDDLPPYTGQIPAIDMLKHERRAALFVTGVRLLDMYRFGIQDPLWHPTSDAFTKPGTLLPITCIERNANPGIPDC